MSNAFFSFSLRVICLLSQNVSCKRIFFRYVWIHINSMKRLHPQWSHASSVLNSERFAVIWISDCDLNLNWLLHRAAIIWFIRKIEWKKSRMFSFFIIFVWLDLHSCRTAHRIGQYEPALTRLIFSFYSHFRLSVCVHASMLDCI